MKKALLLFIIILHSFILTKLIFFPYPELFIYPYLTNHNLSPYSQLLDQHFPGLLFMPINFNNLGMTTPDIARIWLIGLVILNHILLFLISRSIFKDDKKALVVSILYLIWQPFFEGWVLWIDSFMSTVFLSAFYFLQKKRYFIAGILIGLSVVFKQTAIPLSIILSLYLFWQTRSFKKISPFLCGLIIPPISMLLYIFSLGVFKEFWYWTGTYNLKVYPKYGTKIPPTIGFITRAFLVYLPSVLILFNKEKTVRNLLTVFILGSMVGIFDRADFVHFQPSLPFILIAAVLGVATLFKKNVIRIGIIGYILVTVWWLQVFYKGHLSDKVLLFDKSVYETAQKIEDLTDPNDKIFVFGAVPHLYQLSNTLPAGDVLAFQFPWYMRVVEDSILEGLKKDKPTIVVSERENVIEGSKIKDFAPKIDQYIQDNYEIIDSVGSTSILRKID